MKKTKIICSIGPASIDPSVMSELVNKGMNCARINMSHSDFDGALDIIKSVREVRKRTKKHVAIMYDTKGPEFRTLEVEDGVFLEEDSTIKIVKDEVKGTKESFSVNHPEAIERINVGSHVLIDNALMDLEVIEKNNDYIVCKVKVGGELKSHKTLNVPGVNLNLPFISKQDHDDIAFAAKHSCDYLALSFVSSKEDVIAARKIIEENGGDAKIISKIESQTGIENINEIIMESDGIMVARGDLGVEVDMEDLPYYQKMIIRRCREQGKFAIVATEMLASMYTSSRPTRAEVSDIYNAVLEGTDCVMLSGETTVGKYPVEAVKYMADICESAEKELLYFEHFNYLRKIYITDTIAKCVVEAVDYDNIKCVVATTISGYTARRISNLRPNCPIIACCPSDHIAEKVNLNFGVLPVVMDICDDTEEIVQCACKKAKEILRLKSGDKIIITGGFPLGISHTTNFMRIEEID